MSDEKQPIEVRDNRDGRWFWLHTEILRASGLHLAAKAVYAALASYTNQTQTAYPSITSIAKDTNLSLRTVSYALKKLKDFDLIQVSNKPGRVSHYTLLKVTPAKVAVLNQVTAKKRTRRATPAIDDVGNQLQDTPAIDGVRSRTIEQESTVLLRKTAGGINYEFQDRALRIIKRLGTPKNAQNRVFAAVKKETPGTIDTALSFAADYEGTGLTKTLMFFWRLSNEPKGVERAN